MLNQKTILEWSIVNCSFFLNPITSLANYSVLQITFQATKIKMAKSQYKISLIDKIKVH